MKEYKKSKDEIFKIYVDTYWLSLRSRRLDYTWPFNFEFEDQLRVHMMDITNVYCHKVL